MEGKSPVRTKDYRTFVFDLDGTLFTIPIDWVSVRSDVENVLGERLGRMPLFVQLLDALARRPELKAPVFSAVDSYEMRAASLAEPKPGALELLALLSGRARLGMVTLQGRPICNELSRRFKLKDVFRTQITREDSLDRAEQLRMAIEAIGASPRGTLFVGDMANDVACARRTGVDVVIMGSRYAADQKPDHSFLSFAELRAFLA